MLQQAGATITIEADAILVTGMETSQIGYLAAEKHIAIYELSLHRASLEDAFMELTEDSVEYHQIAPKSGAVTEAAPALAGKATR